MFKVVILSALASNLIACVRSILALEPELSPDRIIIVDDGAKREAEAKLPGVRWLRGIKPFIYARNANIGIREAEADVILLNDDTRLVTRQGFSKLSQQVQVHSHIGLCSAGIKGAIGNPRQVAASQREIRLESQALAFVCVYIPRRVYDKVGCLDERFVGYGFEDNDYCERVRTAGWQLGIWDGCVVDHNGELPSTFRKRPDFLKLLAQNRQLFEAKQREGRMTATQSVQERCVDLLYLACNRLEFTRETFTTLLANTDWSFVHELFVYDDGSVDGTREWLEQNIGCAPAPVRFVKTSLGSPVTAMNHFIVSSGAPILAKTDNDAMLPPGWLIQSLEVLKRHPELMLLGIEAINPHQIGANIPRSYTEAEFISGLGLYRRVAFSHSRPIPYNKYFGLEEWQAARGPHLVRGWINPAVPVFLLDRCPFEPWKSYSDLYIERGWQRPWQRYDSTSELWKWRFLDCQAEAKVTSNADLTRINMGYYTVPQEGFINVGLAGEPGVKIVDLKKPWPWEDNSIQHIRAWDIIEHLPDKIFTMNEIWRVLRKDGTAEIVVPTTDGSGAFQDPTHVSYWNRRSFLYYEAGSPYRERFANRYGIRAKFQVLREWMEPTPDGPRLNIMLEAVKTAFQERIDADSRFLCAMRVKNESKNIFEVISSVLPLCQTVVVFDDHSTDETVEICRSFGGRVKVYPSPFKGLDEARDKNYLLEKIIEMRPEWVLWIDGDEVLERSGPKRLKDAIENSMGSTAFSLRIAYLWNDPQHIRVDGIYGQFARPSLFRLKAQPFNKLHFRTTQHGGNFHCGNIPQGLVGEVRGLDVRLKHYGYLTPKQRQAKYKWYTTIDPGNEAEDQYRHLLEIPEARHAPGPPKIELWEENEI